MMFLAAMSVRAQSNSEPEPSQQSAQSAQTGPLIKIQGSVYGGGRAGNMTGGTTVTVYAGDLNEVYGGAQMANVGGSAFVNIDGSHASDNIIINKVYGGNDVAGTVGTSESLPKDENDDPILTNTSENNIDESWNAFVRTSTTQENGKDKYRVIIGSLFGGGNGDYDYTTEPTQEVENPYYGMSKPELASTYLELKGGCIAHVYGGGNNATVTENTTICIDNQGSVLHDVLTADDNFMELAKRLGLSTYQSNVDITDYHFARVFGGNNKADMAIMPKWDLKKGNIRDLYSGGNEGRMISPVGIMLEIQKGSEIMAYNVYGGCRKANVEPLSGGVLVDHVSPLENYYFPKDFAARLIVRGGDIYNVYGGNDISGKVYFGNAVGIYHSIKGNVYGGGNGSYAYTDNAQLKDVEGYGDFYYEVPDGQTSVDALNAFRPNAEQVSICVAGEVEGEGNSQVITPTIIHGSVFCGGNSATLKKIKIAKPLVELKIGYYAIMDKVFLGCNGENMIDEDVLKQYAGNVTVGESSYDFSQMNLKNSATFAKYMDGCAMDIIPSVVFENQAFGDRHDYKDYTSYIGSFYCGGNVGSMIGAGTTNIDFDHTVIVYNKLVGGCNNAIVKETRYNALYEGGIIGSEAERGTNYYTEDGSATGNIKDRLVLNLASLRIQPKRWNDVYEAVASGTTLTSGNKYYTSALGAGEFTSDGTEEADGTNYYEFKAAGTELVWNTVDGNGDPTEPVTSGTTFTSADLNRRFIGGDIYGGCYTSGIVNGNVVINLDGTIVDRGKKDSEMEEGEVDYGVFDGVAEDEDGEAILYGHNSYTIEKRRSGVILDEQGMDVLGKALNVFGGGKGKDTEIWGSTTINLNAGYTFQIFGGSQEGVIGRPTRSSDKADFVYDTTDSTPTYSFNKKLFTYDPRYSCYVNLKGKNEGVSKQQDHTPAMAECEFMYGGGFEGPICGNTVINLGAGRIFNSFAGSCNADILGHTETYIGRQVKDEYKLAFGKYVNNENTYVGGFPWIRDITYGANDLGGRILGEVSFKDRVRKADDPYGLKVLGMVHKYNASTNPNPDVLTAGAYTEYLQGRADAVFGGCYGTYDYKSRKFSKYTSTDGEPLKDTGGNPKFFKPRVNNAFVNFRPTYYSDKNVVKKVYGAGQGQSGETDRDLLQNRSYVLIDIPQIDETTSSSESSESSEAVNFNKYTAMEVFGAGAWGGLGMKYSYDETTAAGFDLDRASAIIDLVRGDISAVYGGSYEEGVTRRTVVNVPEQSTINIENIFGGAYGTQILPPCDVYESHVNYRNTSENARVTGAIYGGNNNERRTMYTQVNILSPVWSDKTNGYLAKIYGAGKGVNTWSEYTEVNLERGAKVYEAYGGGEMGHVLNAQSVQKYMTLYIDYPSEQISKEDATWSDDQYWNHDEEGNKTTFISSDNNMKAWQADWKKAWTLGNDYYTPNATFDNYASNAATNLSRISARPELGTKTAAQLHDKTKFNTNVIINEGATVVNYAYAGGYGDTGVPRSGDVYGTTYITLLGGTVNKDIYASGTAGGVYDLFGVGDGDSGFTASANAYIKGGTVRNVYGGGWRGSVGYHAGLISDVANNSTDREGHVHVIIGDADGTSHISGIPSVTRNVYGGGEGGGVYGDAHVILNKGYIGYRYNGTLSDDPATKDFDERYVAELDDERPGDKLLEKGGNVFGGGYVANSYVDRSIVTMYDGVVRGGLYGGGEIGPIGRGTVKEDAPAPTGTITSSDTRNKAKIYKGGETNVYLYDGHVMRDVFGGGRGYDNWGGDGWMTEEEKKTMDRSSKGYVFGSTNVHIYGGEIGTEAGVLLGYGNVFGGGNEGFVYSATGKKVGSDRSDEHLTNGIPTDGGGFYYVGGNKSNPLTRDCYVEVSPMCKVKTGYVEIGDDTYNEGDFVPTEALNKLKNRNNSTEWNSLDLSGVVIHNALFAGGNITEGSDKLFANTITVYGNAAASLRDVYNIDLITLGTEDMGGLYGDGNLTLVDGFRELHIDNYGTDYYSLNETMTITDYEKLTERQQAYYKLKYVTSSDHTYEYYESKTLHTYTIKDGEGNVVSETPYKRGEKVTAATWATFSSAEQANWVQGRKTYQKDDQIEESEWILMDAGEQAAWILYGVTSIYAGRPMNTIQRADMCGVFGSRMVLKGAQDRVPEAVDYTNYTINRVDEVSLNKRTSEAGDSGGDAEHGNYFGIYNVVNYLGNLTSDVFFDDVRKTDSKIDANKGKTKETETPYGTATYYQWKAEAPQAKNRNNGTSRNMVALASGVYLEIKREEGEATGEDDWGYITGVIELDLINVMQGMGGGYVYARNEHGVKELHPEYGKVTMLAENESARTYRRFKYTNTTPGTNKQVIQTSGNFVHNTKQIVDDCYPNSGMYNPDKVAYEDSPAHYWFIRGSIYVYDQYISAYTGSANAYAEKVEMPLTIAAAANGRMTLREVQPNYYAYYDKNGNKLGDKTPGVNADEHLIINNKTYQLNDPVSYWEYRLMSDADRSRFEKETYVVIEDCSVNGTAYAKGDVLTMAEYNSLKGTGSGPAVTYTEGDETKTDGNFLYFFRSSNNISHDTGYVLTYDINNPGVWNNYYTKTEAPAQANKLNTTQYGALTSGQNLYTEGPTYTPKSGNSVFGQEEIKMGNIVYGTMKTKYDTDVKGRVKYPAVEVGTTLTEGKTYYTTNAGDGIFVAAGTEVVTSENQYFAHNQATVTEKAYVVTKEYSVKDKNGAEVQHLNPGTPIYASKYADTEVYSSNLWTYMTSHVAEEAKVCKKLLEFSQTDYVYAGQLLTAADIAELKTKVKAKMNYTGTDADSKAEAYLSDYIDDAYYCTEGGLYGGTYFEAGKAYRAIDTWCSMSDADRANFIYNYDALDLLVDPTYCGRLDDTYDLDGHYGFKPQYDGYAPESTQEAVEAGTASAQYTGSTPLRPAIYSKTQPIDYQAECTTAISYTDESGASKSYAKNSAQTSWLTREQYEDIPNEKHHYSPITVTAPGDYYVVKKAFMRGDVPYTIGQVIDSNTYQSMTIQQRTNIDVVTFTEDHTSSKIENGETVYVPVDYFYCREAYTINEKGEGKPVKAVVANANGRNSEGTTVAISEDDIISSGVVPAGFIIAEGSSANDQYTYNSLPNFQSGNFLIHGTSPTEVSTLYVSSESDINDLSKEKIITVVYLYEYEESDESGLNVVPVSERHIVNIHINFKSGVPEVGDIDPPAIVLPGTTLGLNIPTVTQGAYRVTESGWEIFENSSDATTHYNGEDYYNNETPVWWYQNGYYIAYYAKTRLGKTYSNSVPVRVANYHDMKKVWNDNLHHYYIDHKDVDYEPKIYINDYSKDETGGKNGLDMFRNLIDLSHKTLEYEEVPDPEDNTKTIIVPKPYNNGSDNNDPLNGHVPLDNTHAAKPMRGGQYLEFFLRADQDHTGSDWTPIANNDGECFSGVLHGDGYTISGLTNSLFNHLCGNVYNLGVTGSFTGAGVAETGDGYVENCWINTTGTPNGSVYAVFGNPTDGDVTTKQIVNCYYQETKNYKTTSSDHGLAKPMPEKAFYNGEVAYDLNGFYLWKRYCDQTVSEGVDYQYYTVGSDNSLTLQPAKYYATDASLCSSGYGGQKYVEDRFADGDFIYAGGTIPTIANERLHTYEEDERTKTAYYPIWPDDYIFFGQALNYGHMDGLNGRDLRTHQDLPSVIKKSNDRVLLTVEGNRVYRAPAYFRSKKMGVAHFNPYAVFAQSKKDDATTLAYKNMTAIDFTGTNETGHAKGAVTTGVYADITGGAFFPPLLDDGGVHEFNNIDLTRNLLAYTMTGTTAAATTNSTVSTYLHDWAYAETNSKYHTVEAYDIPSEKVRGHWVQKSDDSFLAKNDHMLVDKQDFNAPISYSFDADKRMWYQRMPENYVGQKNAEGTGYVDTNAGWEGVSLPFKAEIVTTDVKGEITHFYDGSWKSKNNTDSKIGHEYWLREFKGGDVSASDNKVFEAIFNKPAEDSSEEYPKLYTNTFLWDYYYSFNNNIRTDGNTTGEDQNDDEYQENDYNHKYYKDPREHKYYPRMAAATPYIIGFPGVRYYEFDLSGNFEALTAKSTHPAKLDPQTITFASKPGETTIAVSDDEIVDMVTDHTTYNGYSFKPSYLNSPEVTTGKHAFLLNAGGSSYVEDSENTATAAVVAFRPYFEAVAPVNNNNPSRGTRTIIFGNEQPEDQIIEQHGDPTKEELNGGLHIYTRKGKIYVKSSLSFTEDLRVVTPAGVTVATLTVKPGQTVEVQADFSGMYIVHTLDGLYTRKVAVKRE